MKQYLELLIGEFGYIVYTLRGSVFRTVEEAMKYHAKPMKGLEDWIFVTPGFEVFGEKDGEMWV